MKLVGGRLLPGPQAPAAFLMYESATGERFTLYTSRCNDRRRRRCATPATTPTARCIWADRGVAYVLSGPTDKERLSQVARQVYDQTETNGG